MVIYVRNDDVMIKSKGRSIEESSALFRRVHSIITQNPKFIHVPAIVCKEIEDFPEILSFIKEESKAGRMVPEVHCWEHIDYGRLSENQVVDHLKKCKRWFETNSFKAPTKFFTPWASESPTIQNACERVGLEMVGGKRNFLEPHKYVRGDYPLTDKCTIAMHWWKLGDVNKLERLVSL